MAYVDRLSSAGLPTAISSKAASALLDLEVSKYQARPICNQHNRIPHITTEKNGTPNYRNSHFAVGSA